MEDLTYYLSQKIGVYYKDAEWKQKMFDKILNHYPKEWISKTSKAIGNTSIELKDGTRIEFVYASENARGCCFSKIIIQHDIDKELLNCRILPALKHFNRRAMLLNEDGSVFDFV